MFEANLTLKSKDLLVDETGLDEIAVDEPGPNPSILPTAVADLASLSNINSVQHFNPTYSSC